MSGRIVLFLLKLKKNFQRRLKPGKKDAVSEQIQGQAVWKKVKTDDGIECFSMQDTSSGKQADPEEKVDEIDGPEISGSPEKGGQSNTSENKVDSDISAVPEKRIQINFYREDIKKVSDSWDSGMRLRWERARRGAYILEKTEGAARLYPAFLKEGDVIDANVFNHIDNYNLKYFFNIDDAYFQKPVIKLQPAEIKTEYKNDGMGTIVLLKRGYIRITQDQPAPEEQIQREEGKMDNKILVTRSSMPPLDEYIEEIRPMWDTHWLTNMGPKHKELQEELKEYLSVENIDLLTNGHMALELSMQALGLKGEVITTPFTFASTTHAIVRNGCTPVFCNINPDDFTMDTSMLEDLITDQTSAIVPVHVYGNVCNIEEIERIANKYSLKVIYDAAHTFGERYKGRGIGSFGDVSYFSFHATKVFNSIEGGAVCFRDEEFGKSIYQLKNFGIHGPEVVDGVGANAKMSEFCAAMGLCNLRHVDEEIAKRKRVVERYRERIGGIDGVRLNPVQKDVEPNYAYFPVVFDEKVFGASRNEVFNALAAEGIGARKYFYPLTNTFDCFHEMYDANLTPVALHVSKRVLTLPLYADLALEDVDRICDTILGCRKL